MDSIIFNTHDVILLMTVFQCVFFSILLLALSGKQTAKSVFLALFLLSQAAIPLDILINFGAEFRNVVLNFSPNLFYVFGFAYWLEGPLILWYIRSELYKNYQVKQYEWLYLVPFLAYLGYEILFYYSLTAGNKLSLQQGYELSLAPKYMNYITLLRELIRLGFGLACIIEIRRYRVAIRDNFSNVHTMDFKWLNLLVDYFIILRVIAVLVAVMILSTIHFNLRLNFSALGLTSNYLAFFLTSILIFCSLRYSTLSTIAKEPLGSANHDGKQSFSEKDITTLIQHLDSEKPYLQPALTIDELSAQIKIDSKTLSSILNRHFKKNFFEFINHYRINESKALLRNAQNSHMNILDILYASGFNSKATFNTLFKKSTKQTPSEYRKNA